MALKPRTSTAASAGPGSQAQSRLQRLREQGGRSAITWAAATPALLAECVAAVSSQGALISFSVTSDGGALNMYVKDGVEAENFYASNEDELERIMREAIETYS